MKPLLSIIIVNYNTKELLQKCLKSVISDQWLVVSKKTPITSHQSLTTEIIVVDNGSTDGSVEMVTSGQWLVASEKTKKTPITNHQSPATIRLIKNQTNLGFAKAVNQGIKQSRGEYLLLLNSDIVVKPNSIKRLVDFAKKHPGVGVVGGRLLNLDGSIQGSCFYLPTISRAFREFWLKQKKFPITQKYAPAGDKPVEVEAVVGAVFLIPKKVLAKVGFLDERYFMYFEDLDYCRRVRKAGLKVFYVPQAEFIHYHGLSGKKIPEKTQKWLVESSQIYHGCLKYYLLSLIIWTGQKCQKIFEK